MGSSYNRITIIGNLGRDPEMRAIPSGDMVAGFTVATTERGKNGDQTTWFRVSAFGKLAETCNQYLRKGSYVYIEGPLTQREYTDREGATRQSLDVRAREMRMLDKRGEGAADVAAAAGGAQIGGGSRPVRRPAAAAEFDDSAIDDSAIDDSANMDDIPFRAVERGTDWLLGG